MMVREEMRERVLRLRRRRGEMRKHGGVGV